MFPKLLMTPGRSSVPDGERIYAIGDIHGCATLLDRLLERIEADCNGSSRRLVFLGDYVDRGPDSRGVIERLWAISQREPDAVFLMGNHERAMLDFLADARAGAEWLHWGGDKTAESYGVDGAWREEPEDVGVRLGAAIPAAHLEFLRGLSLHFLRGDYLFVHAGVRPGIPLGDQTEDDLLWIREDFHNAPAAQRPDKVVVHGHHPLRKPLDAGWRIAVDTGAVWSDVLTCVALTGVSRRFLST